MTDGRIVDLCVGQIVDWSTLPSQSSLLSARLNGSGRREHLAPFGERLASFLTHLATFGEQLAPFLTHLASFGEHLALFSEHLALISEPLAAIGKLLAPGGRDEWISLRRKEVGEDEYIYIIPPPGDGLLLALSARLAEVFWIERRRKKKKRESN
jgi:hypothetical protein